MNVIKSVDLEMRKLSLIIPWPQGNHKHPQKWKGGDREVREECD